MQRHMSSQSLVWLPEDEASHPTSQSAPPHAPLNSSDMMLSVLECYMTECIRRNEVRERMARNTTRLNLPHALEPSVFHALQAPSITPVEYLRRLARYCFCSRSVFVAAFYYLERLSFLCNIDLTITTLSIHRLILTSVLLATKVIDDVLYDNAHFAKVGGLDVKELNMLELDFLKVLDFKLCISAEQFEDFEQRILEVALYTTHPDYAMLPGRLRNMGYQSTNVNNKALPSSPTSSMEVSFYTE